MALKRAPYVADMFAIIFYLVYVLLCLSLIIFK